MGQIRLWKLGDLDRNILPTPQAMQRLAEILSQNPTDIIWGPELNVEVIQIDDNENKTIVTSIQNAEELKEFLSTLKKENE